MTQPSIGQQVSELTKAIKTPTIVSGSVSPQTLVYVNVGNGMVAIPVSELLPASSTFGVQEGEERHDVMITVLGRMLEQSKQQLIQVENALTESKQLIETLKEEIESFSAVKAKANEKQAFHPEESVYIGVDAMVDGAIDRENVAIGLAAGAHLEGAGNTLVGPYAGAFNEGEFSDVTAIGYQAMAGHFNDFKNVTAIGARANATGDNQIVLGDHQTHLQVLGAVHRRADPRDMREPKKCEVGLDMVLNINPLQYREDFRDAYIDWTTQPVSPEPLRPMPNKPDLEITDPDYQPSMVAYQSDLALWKREEVAYLAANERFQSDLEKWLIANNFTRVVRNGSHAGKRLHLGFNGRQILKYCQKQGLDLGAVQIHEKDGGASTTSVSEMELVPVLWTAIQELYQIVHSTQFIDVLHSKLSERQTSSE